MALEDKPISWFPTAPEITTNSLLFVSTPSGNSYDSNSAPAGELGEAIVSDFEYTQELETEDKTLTGAVNELLTYAANIAEEYDPSETYAVGDFCLHEGVLYKCTTAIPIAEAWTAAHWTSTLIVDNFGAGGGASVTLGTTVPSDASGNNGDLYVQYNGTSYEVIEYYVKINGSWRKSPYSRVVALTQAEYDLITPDPSTLYIITDKQGSYVKLPVITDAYDSTATYNTGDYCIYNDTLYKCNADNTTGTWDAQYWDATSVAEELADLETGKQDKLSFHSANSSTAISVNGTYQIPANVLAHTFIVVTCRRSGLGNSAMFKTDELLTFDNGITFLATGSGYYTLKCSNTGLLTVTNIVNLTDPYILVTGLL